jgi:hypothetical protein
MADAVKRCPKCTQELPVSAFYTNRAAYDGLSPYCKPCWLAVTNARHTAKRAGLVDKRRIQMAQVHHDYFSSLDTPKPGYTDPSVCARLVGIRWHCGSRPPAHPIQRA